MSRYINADKAIEYFKKAHKLQTAKILNNMADSKDYFLCNVVSREQFNECYEENLRLRCLNEQLLSALREYGDCAE